MERKWWTLLASCIAIFMLLLDVTIVNVALPSIERALGADFSDLQWVIDAYALTLAGLLLAAGSLADKVGRRLVFMLGLAIFTASSLACGVAPDPLFLHVSRAAQGVGGAMMFGTSLALIAQEFQGRERGTALGIWGATTAAAVSTGPLVGGALVDALSWRWIFLVNVPIGLAALVVARLRLRESRDPAASGVDMRGVALLCPALFLLVYALIRGNDEGRVRIARSPPRLPGAGKSGVWVTGWRLRLGAVDFDHRSRKGLGSLLGKVVSDAALDRPVRILA